MTSRLKRKLGELGVDTSSRRANENFCLIGTPLPPLEKSKDTGEFVPLWKQEVRDEKGRRRLHGAFTGGWSAGYYNSVGSKEGWAPSTFVSSRSDRVKKQTARPEDFMDEEDLQDLKDNFKLVDTTEEMDLLGGTQAELNKTNDDETEPDPIQLTLQTTLLPPPKFSIGAKILQKMGWRTGQGIGPRVSLARRRVQDAQAYDPFTGTRLTSGSLEIPEEDDEATKHLYAPRDVPILSVKRKDNSHGMGYVPGTTLHSTLGASSSSSSGPRLAGGFGLGALNEADEDDLDVYDSLRHPSSSRRVAYDHVEGEDDDIVVIGRNGTRKADAGTRKGTSTLHKATVPSSHLRDGRPVLQGFILSVEPVAQDKWFPLPDIPQGWKPNPRSLWDGNKENTTAPPPLPTAQHAQGEAQSHAKWKSSQLSADQRGSLLGETPLPGPAKSVFEYMSEKDRERIQRIASNFASGKTSSTPGVHPSFSTTSETTATIPPPPAAKTTSTIEPHVAQAALLGFQPFTTDPVKQARYTTFLQSFASGSTTTPSLQPLPDQTNGEFTKELTDFSKAAALFKPMSGAMQGRFMSASVLDMGPRIIEGLHHPSSSQVESEENEGKEEIEPEKEENVDPKVNAAKMGMYGPLTREAKPWVPARLLCKRFGVREPNSSTEDAKPGPSTDLSVAPSSSVTVGTNAGGTTRAGAGTEVGGPRDITNLGLGEDETQGLDILTYQRPTVDVFKAIFASDDEDEDEDDGDVGVGIGDEKYGEGVVEGKGGGFTSATVILENNDEPVDPETFKPKFVPRKGGRDNERKKDQGKEEKGEKKEKKDKKEKKRKEKGKDKKVLVSFELDETRSEGDFREPKENRPAKKRRKERGVEGEQGGDGHALQEMTIAGAVESNSIQPSVISTNPETVNRGRKRAVDFMD